MADIPNYQRFVNEIERTDERIRNYVLLLQNSINDYLDAMFEDLSSPADENEFLAIIGGYSGLSSFRSVIKEVKKVTTLYQSELRVLKPRFGVTEEDADLTVKIAKQQQAKIINDLMGAITAIGSSLILAKTLTGKRATKSDLKETYIEPKLNQVETELVTNVNGYRSGMEIRKAKELVSNPKFAYVGPRDNRNRPLCRYILDRGQLWTEKEIRELDGHPDANYVPVMVYRGGYNCRHRWIYTDRP